MRIAEQDRKMERLESRMREMFEKMKEMRKKLAQQEEKIVKMKKDREEKEKEWGKREEKWVMEDLKFKKRMEERMKRVEKRLEMLQKEKSEEKEKGRKKRVKKEKECDDWEMDWSWDEWSEVDSEEDWESEREAKEKGVKSRVVLPKETRERKEKEKEAERLIFDKYKNKVLIFKKGNRWNDSVSIEEWVMQEAGVKVAVEKIKGSEDHVKLWCDIKGVKEIVWRKREEWKNLGFGKLEEWLSREERRERYEKRMVEVEVRERLEKKRRDRSESGDESSASGQGWRLEEWRGEKARSNRKLKCQKRD